MYCIKEEDKEAVIFLNKEELYGDTNTIKQIRRMITHPAVEHARIMPDCHFGMGCCVGFTSRLNDKIVPNFIGGDIGCGIVTYPLEGLNLSSDKKLERIERQIRETIPTGTSIHSEPVVTKEDLEWLFSESQQDADAFSQAQVQAQTPVVVSPTYNQQWFDNLMIRVRSNLKLDMKSLGTLGGGNHFVEINYDATHSLWYLTIHSGSRNLGQKICRYHQDIISVDGKFPWDTYNHEIKLIERKTKDPKQRHSLEQELHDKLKSEQHKPYLEGDEAYQYYFDMIFAQKYAVLNRHIMIREFCTRIGLEFDRSKIIESIHNYIDFKDMIWRKGAVASYSDKWVIVALNMRDGILLCKGKSNSEWNYSAAHGAGRLYPRNEVGNHITMKQFRESMKDIYSTTVVEETLDEAPMAYKNTDLIKNRLTDTVDILLHMPTVVNVKATS